MEKTIELSKILTVKQVQENLGIGRNKVFAREDFTALKLGRKFGVDKEAFEEWKKKSRTNKDD